MNVSNLSKKVLASVLALSLLSPAIAMADDDYYDNDDRIEHEIRSDANYRANVQKARAMLEARGYRVEDIEADEHRGQKTLEVEARKNGHEYDIRLAYPSLTIISERRDD